jgi:hypothetical protein
MGNLNTLDMGLLDKASARRYTLEMNSARYDIVDYLRAGHSTQYNCDKAADEILALRRALQRIYLFSDYDFGAPPLRSAAEMMRDIAKTALQGSL